MEVGFNDGVVEGLSVGLCEGSDGASVGKVEGYSVGFSDGPLEGFSVGVTEGLRVGVYDGVLDGISVGVFEGAVGAEVAESDGALDGTYEGLKDGAWVEDPVTTTTAFIRITINVIVLFILKDKDNTLTQIVVDYFIEIYKLRENRSAHLNSLLYVFTA